MYIFLKNSVLLVLFFTVSSTAVAQSEDASSEESSVHLGKHLLELGYTSVDGFDGDILVLAPSYTYSSSPNLRFSGGLEILMLDPIEVDGDDNADVDGLGDTYLSIQYDPKANLTSSPWIPNSLGLFAEISFPTGDAEEGLGGGSWGVSAGFGWPLPVSENFLALPSIAYTRTVHHGNFAIPIDELGVGFSLIWNSPFGAWFAIEPFVAWDFEVDETVNTTTIAIGKSFPNGLGVDLHWGQRSRFESLADRSDDVLIITLNWQFGSPP